MSSTGRHPRDDVRVRRFTETSLAAVVENSEFGHITRDWSSGGRRLCTTDLAQLVPTWQRTWAPKLDRLTKRRLAALEVADRLDRMAPEYRSYAKLDRLIDALRKARTSASAAVRLADGKWIRRWDVKTGNSRVDPDDAREEAQRFAKRVQPALERQVADGCYLTYGVFTTPNVELGKLRAECSRIMRRLSNLLRRAKRGHIPGCENIEGAIAVLEAPLSARGEWNVHVNVILVHRGPWIDYGRLREAWHWNVELRRLEGSPESIAAAMREVIKYSVRTVAEKSAGKARGGDTDAPAFVDWPDAAIFEWLQAFTRFRRSRTYGSVYRLPKPEKLDRAEYLELGVVFWKGRRGGYGIRFPLVDSIPGDKSATIEDRVAAFFGRFTPADASDARSRARSTA